MRYDKLPLSFSEQVKLWQSRGLIVDNVEFAESILQNISYYRLSAYALPFQGVKDCFNSGTQFEDILDLYQFDRELRLLVLDAIERIEVALRAQFIYTLAHKYGSHWQDDPTLFKRYSYKTRTGKTQISDVFLDIQEEISDHLKGKFPEVFIKHYKDTYHAPRNPPSWMVVELFTMGKLSRIYSGLKQPGDQKAIADHFEIKNTLLESWLYVLSYGRNLCAHHSRLWNRDFVIQPHEPKKTMALPWLNTSFPNRRAFYFLSIIKYLLQTVGPDSQFKDQFISLIEKHKSVPIKFMGIPTTAGGKLCDWAAEPVWRG